MLSKLPRRNSNTGKDFYAMLSTAEKSMPADAKVQQGKELAWAIYHEKFKLEAEGAIVTHPIDFDFLAGTLEVAKENLLRVLKRELDENADYITFTEVLPAKECLLRQNGRSKRGHNVGATKYYLTSQAAIQLCMASRAERARGLRKFMAAFMDSCMDYVVKAKYELEAGREQALLYARSEHSMQSLLANVYSMLGRRFYTEFRYGNAYADCVYLARKWVIVQEFKRGTVNESTIADELATFDLNKHALQTKWQGLQPRLWLIAPAFTDTARLFARVNKVRLLTIAELRDDSLGKLCVRCKSNMNVLARQKRELHQSFDYMPHLLG